MHSNFIQLQAAAQTREEKKGTNRPLDPHFNAGARGINKNCIQCSTKGIRKGRDLENPNS